MVAVQNFGRVPAVDIFRLNDDNRFRRAQAGSNLEAYLVFVNIEFKLICFYRDEISNYLHSMNTRWKTRDRR